MEIAPNEEEWRRYFANFQKHKITEDVLVDLASDKQKSEMWKELIPELGPRIKFIKAWDNEMLRHYTAR